MLDLGTGPDNRAPLEVTCPLCRAPAGYPCRTETMGHTEPHASRRALYNAYHEGEENLGTRQKVTIKRARATSLDPDGIRHPVDRGLSSFLCDSDSECQAHEAAVLAARRARGLPVGSSCKGWWY